MAAVELASHPVASFDGLLHPVHQRGRVSDERWHRAMDSALRAEPAELHDELL